QSTRRFQKLSCQGQQRARRSAPAWPKPPPSRAVLIGTSCPQLGPTRADLPTTHSQRGSHTTATRLATSFTPTATGSWVATPTTSLEHASLPTPNPMTKPESRAIPAPCAHESREHSDPAPLRESYIESGRRHSWTPTSNR